MGHKERATELFKRGFNCAQAVFCAFCEENGMDFETAAKLASPLGGGLGRLREVCGAVSGMSLAASFYLGYSDPDDKEAKTELYASIQEMAKEFKQQNGSIVCRELLGLEGAKESPAPAPRTDEFYKKRPCAELVGCAAEILERRLAEMKEKS